MTDVKEVLAKHKIQMQLGVPFFMLVIFFVAVVVFGTLYFAGNTNSSGNVDPQTTAQDASAVIQTFLDQMLPSTDAARAIFESTTTDEISEDSVREVLALNKSFLALAFFNEDGTRAYELHKSRVTPEALTLLNTASPFVGLLDDSGTKGFLYNGDGFLLVVTSPPNEKSMLVTMFSTNDLEEVLKNLANGVSGKIQLADSKNIASFYTYDALPLSPNDITPKNVSLRALVESNQSKYGYATDSGVNVRGHWLEVEDTPWVLSVEVQFVQNAGALNSIYFTSAFILLILIAFIFYYLYVFNQKLIKPIRKIEKVMNYFETGDYSEQMSVDTKNEFAEIAELMNNMARHVENNTSERVSQLKKVLDRQNTDTRLLIEKDVELREKGQKLKELDAAKSMFVSVAAHQMRTPLAAIKWSLKLVMDGDVGPVNAEQKEYLEKGYESTTRMINLINDLLDVDKIESDKFSYTFKEEQLEGIVQGIIDDLTPISTEKGVNLQFQKDADKYPPISADVVKLRNALQNLIDNAVKYTIGGGDVTVKLRLEGKTFKLSISDTGIGIPVSEQGKVFGKFFRAKNAVSQETDGSGLGLFIVKKIIEKHGGSATFESKEGKGTTFLIDIPVMKK